MELKQRKPNRIPDYDYSQDGVYFITVCTQKRKHCLSRITGQAETALKENGIIVEEFIKQLSHKYPGVYADQYVIMPDHIHMLLRFAGRRSVTASELGTVVGWFKYQITKQVNARSGNIGEKLFQRSYYDHVIRNQQDYNETWEYIANNPRKWLMQKRGME